MSNNIGLWVDETNGGGAVSYKTGRETPGFFYRKIAEIDQKTFRKLRRRALRKSYNEALIKRSDILMPLIVTGFMLSFVTNFSTAAIFSGTAYLIIYSILFFKVRSESIENHQTWLSRTLEAYVDENWKRLFNRRDSSRGLKS